MSDFLDKYGQLTVAEAIELNNKAKLTCGWEITTQTEESDI